VIRVYLPLNRAVLESASEAGEIGPAPLAAYSVTPELRAAYGAGLDVEELEYAAYDLAVAASRAMLDPDRPDDRRRLVAAADVEAARPRPGGEPGEVTVTEPVTWSAVVSVHADVDDLADDDDPELAWFATQEVPELLR
jgi:hypothetical protein